MKPIEGSIVEDAINVSTKSVLKQSSRNIRIEKFDDRKITFDLDNNNSKDLPQKKYGKKNVPDEYYKYISGLNKYLSISHKIEFFSEFPNVSLLF